MNNKKNICIYSAVFIAIILFLYYCYSLRRIVILKQRLSNIDYIIYGIGVVVIAALVIYWYICNENETSDYIKNNNNSLKENIKNMIGIQYKFKNFNNDDDEYYIKEDVEIFTAYDSKVELPKYYVEPYEIQYDYILKMERENKEIIFCGNEAEEIEYGYRRRSKTYHINFAIFKEIDNLKRLHIKTKEYIPSKIKGFEDVFEDFEKNVQDVDKKYKKEYETYFNRKYNNNNNEYIKLTDSQKELLIDLYKQSKLNFTVVLDNGFLRIYVNFHGYLTDYTEIDQKVISEQIANIFIKLIEEFK